MRLNLLLLLPFMLFPSYSCATVSQDIPQLIKLAGKEYMAGNYDRAVLLYKQADALGSPKAKIRLSGMYRSGKRVTKNEKLAKKYLHDAISIYERRAHNGDVDALYQLGTIYSFRVNPPQKQVAYKWLLKAANLNHVKAQYFYASLLERDREANYKTNRVEAFKWYKKAAEQGSPRAAFKIAATKRGDFNHVIKWCLPAAKQEHSKCVKMIHVIAGRYLTSEEYKQRSIDVLRELADSNVIMTQTFLSMIYKQGNVVNKDLEEANKWSRKAFSTALSKSQNGDRQSQFELSLLYLNGIGTDKDVEEARKWLSKAAKQGHKKARVALTKLPK